MLQCSRRIEDNSEPLCNSWASKLLLSKKKKHKLMLLFVLMKRTLESGVVTLLLDSNPVPVFCHMGDFGCGDGGWTPVMKIDGSKVFSFVVFLVLCLIFFMYM